MQINVRAVLLMLLGQAYCCAPTSAHDLWITLSGAQQTRSVVLNYGHPNDRPPTAADKVVDLLAISGAGQKSLLEGLDVEQSGGVIVVRSKPFDDTQHALIAARYDNGYWAEIAENFYRNTSRRVVPGAKDSLWSMKFAKAITGRNAPWDKVVGHVLEIVPMTDPAAVKEGEALRVRVLFAGKPLPGVQVERGDGLTPLAETAIAKFTANGDGVLDIPIVARGPQLLAIDYRVTPSATPDLAAADLYNATFWFVVP